MQKILVVCAFALFLLPSFAQAQPDSRPKLVVGIVVDQMRCDYLYKYWQKMGNGGFKRLVNKGYFCSNTHYNYTPTYTGPGHACVYTGATPSANGIVANDWYSRSLRRDVYCAEGVAPV